MVTRTSPPVGQQIIYSNASFFSNKSGVWEQKFKKRKEKKKKRKEIKNDRMRPFYLESQS